MVVMGMVYRELLVSFRRACRESIDLDTGDLVHVGGVRSVKKKLTRGELAAKW